jgi:hypothetical protein
MEMWISMRVEMLELWANNKEEDYQLSLARERDQVESELN